jgi:hypothetical protein
MSLENSRVYCTTKDFHSYCDLLIPLPALAIIYCWCFLLLIVLLRNLMPFFLLGGLFNVGDYEAPTSADMRDGVRTTSLYIHYF